MFHDMFVQTVCFTICLFISPDLDRRRAPKKWIINPERPRTDLKSRIRSHRATLASKYGLPNSTNGQYTLLAQGTKNETSTKNEGVTR